MKIDRDALVESFADPEIMELVTMSVLEYLRGGNLINKYCVLPGGKDPLRQSDEAVGFDLHARAIVSALEMNPDEPRLRKTLFDFENLPENPNLTPYIKPDADGLSYIIEPGKSVLIGVGVAFQLNPYLFQWVAPRSGLASKFLMNLGNAPGTIDPDYRGEAGVILMNNSANKFCLTHNMRIAQMIYQPVVIPGFVRVDSLDDFDETNRGSGGFGHTGF